jgi:hypothetical protein
MAAFTIAAYNPANVPANSFIAGYVAYDGGPSRVYASAATIANAGGASASGSPQVAALTQVTAADGAFPDPNSTPTSVGGPYVMKLTPASTDTVNVSSPMSRIYLSPNALVVTISA